ncbi:MAG: isoprenyl transferase [Candidatus Omnitrophota bacterium]
MQNIPQHIAIIMDGNGRWARKRGLPRIAGHRAGAKTADVITEECARLGVQALTLYTFSSENWKRPKKEINSLMGLIERTINKNIKKIKKNNIKFNVIGCMDELPEALQKALKNGINETSSNSGMTLTLALNYGGRREILNAVKAVCLESRGEEILSLEEKDFERFLYTSSLPDPDLVIRTSGEMRLSNFLLWQSAYSELYVSDTLWPDFDAVQLEDAIKDYGKRQRRFGE